MEEAIGGVESYDSFRPGSFYMKTRRTAERRRQRSDPSRCLGGCDSFSNLSQGLLGATPLENNRPSKKPTKNPLIQECQGFEAENTYDSPF